MSVAQAGVNAPNLYVDNLQMAWASDETITIAAGRARNSTNANDIIVESELTVSNIVSGVNGLDSGSVAASTMYAVYVIGSSLQLAEPAGLLSLASNSEPTLPLNYDMYRRVGYILTDGSSDNLLFWQYGNDKERVIYYSTNITALFAGSETSYTDIDLADSVPPIATRVIMGIFYTPDSASNNAEFRPYSSSGNTPVVNFGCGVAAAQAGQIVVPCELDSGVPTIQYKVETSDSLSLFTAGYYDYL